MLEAEEVDDDYFTPVASASLANIFGKSVNDDERSENESLKYTPPKPQITKQPPEDSKATFCVFACVLVGYEWHNKVYNEKGKLGFALIKINRTGSHNIILYDSNKTTLSNASVTSKLKITVKGNKYISYYDDKTKYWSLYGAQNEIKKITDLLKTLNVTINIVTEINPLDINPSGDPPEPIKNTEVIAEDRKKQAESDTDSSINRQTKAAILNRMANMGHSVLPPSVISTNKTSDSSDTNDNDHHIKAVRHKPVKGLIKRNSTDKTLLDQQKLVEIHTNVENTRIGPTEIKPTNSLMNNQLVPITNTAIVTNPNGNNDMNLFIAEQRISNSELRINMGRITDKVDDVINKINNLELKENEGAANVNTEILYKLLREYENKIKVYEDLIKKMGTDYMSTNILAPSNVQSNTTNEEKLQNKIKLLENSLEEKDELVSKLQNELRILQDAKEKQSIVFQKDFSELEAKLTANKIALDDLTKANEKLRKASAGSDIESKVKSVMNDTYQAVATNFENRESYSGLHEPLGHVSFTPIPREQSTRRIANK